MFIIPHVNFPYKTSIDERLIFYNITRCYSKGEYCHASVIKCFALLVVLVYCECCVALPHDATDLSAVCDCGITILMPMLSGLGLQYGQLSIGFPSI